MDPSMEPHTSALLIAVLFFLISFLLNLLQRRYSRTRLNRMLMKEESVVNFLVAVDKYLGKLERNCVLDLQGANSPQEVGKAIHVVRNRIESTIANLGDHLCSFRQYHRKGNVKENMRRQGQKLHQRTSGRKKKGNL